MYEPANWGDGYFDFAGLGHSALAAVILTTAIVHPEDVLGHCRENLAEES